MKTHKTIIIAEAGVNHNGSIENAKNIVDVAEQAGADYVKFQTFKAENIVTVNAEKANYQKSLTSVEESQFEMIKKLELDINAHLEIIKHCEGKNVKFLSTPFDNNSIQMLLDLKIPFFKIPSGEITNLPFLECIGRHGLPIVMSSGMSSLEEVSDAVQVLKSAGTKKDLITILHCNTEYPTPIEDVNLNAMLTIKNKLNVKVGYSDHTLGIEIPIAAVAMGATIIEKHFTLDKNLPGPDHAASLEPDELKAMVKGIRNIEIAFGDGKKRPSSSEKKNLTIVRKSIVAKTKIKKGDTFTENNMSIKRPGTGISPMKWYDLINKKSRKSFNSDDLIEI